MDHLNTGLVWNLDLHCTKKSIGMFLKSSKIVRISDHGLKSGPFDFRILSHAPKSGLVDCILKPGHFVKFWNALGPF
jgi:hypothetical protein